MVRILSVVDTYTRECLALEADTCLGSGRVTRVLERLIGERGRPENLRSDNGPEFTSRRMLGWAEDWKVGLVHIQPGRPMQNGHVESFHGRLRDECLNAHWFRTLNDVRNTLASWRQRVNLELNQNRETPVINGSEIGGTYRDTSGGTSGRQTPRAGCCEVAEGYCGGNPLGAGRLRVKWAVRGCCGSNLRLLLREPVRSKGARHNQPRRRAHAR